MHFVCYEVEQLFVVIVFSVEFDAEKKSCARTSLYSLVHWGVFLLVVYSNVSSVFVLCLKSVFFKLFAFTSDP